MSTVKQKPAVSVTIAQVAEALRDGPGTYAEIALAFNENPCKKFLHRINFNLRYMVKRGTVEVIRRVPNQYGHGDMNVYSLVDYSNQEPRHES